MTPTPPTAVCINGISIALNLNGQAIVTPNLLNNNSFDNCTAPLSFLVQELEVVNGDTIGSPAPQVVFDCEQADNDTQYPVILLVTDQGGNTSICETHVVVQDNVTPVITCPANVTVDCSANLGSNSKCTVGHRRRYRQLLQQRRYHLYRRAPDGSELHLPKRRSYLEGRRPGGATLPPARKSLRFRIHRSQNSIRHCHKMPPSPALKTMCCL